MDVGKNNDDTSNNGKNNDDNGDSHSRKDNVISLDISDSLLQEQILTAFAVNYSRHLLRPP
jgi:hypothetical protein